MFIYKGKDKQDVVNTYNRLFSHKKGMILENIMQHTSNSTHLAPGLISCKYYLFFHLPPREEGYQSDYQQERTHWNHMAGTGYKVVMSMIQNMLISFLRLLWKQKTKFFNSHSEFNAYLFSLINITAGVWEKKTRGNLHLTQQILKRPIYISWMTASSHLLGVTIELSHSLLEFWSVPDWNSFFSCWPPQTCFSQLPYFCQ